MSDSRGLENRDSGTGSGFGFGFAFTNRLTRKVSERVAILSISWMSLPTQSTEHRAGNELGLSSVELRLRLRSERGSLHMACCPSARLNLLSIPLMVARDRNSASLTVKCHKFLRLVRMWPLYCLQQQNRAICSPDRELLTSKVSQSWWNPATKATTKTSDGVGRDRGKGNFKRLQTHCAGIPGVWNLELDKYWAQVVRHSKTLEDTPKHPMPNAPPCPFSASRS